MICKEFAVDPLTFSIFSMKQGLLIVRKIEFVFYLYDWGFASDSRIFHSFGDITIAGEGVQILTYILSTHGQ